MRQLFADENRLREFPPCTESGECGHDLLSLPAKATRARACERPAQRGAWSLAEKPMSENHLRSSATSCQMVNSRLTGARDGTATRGSAHPLHCLWLLLGAVHCTATVSGGPQGSGTGAGSSMATGSMTGGAGRGKAAGGPQDPGSIPDH